MVQGPPHVTAAVSLMSLWAQVILWSYLWSCVASCLFPCVPEIAHLGQKLPEHRAESLALQLCLWSWLGVSEFTAQQLPHWFCSLLLITPPFPMAVAWGELTEMEVIDTQHLLRWGSLDKEQNPLSTSSRGAGRARSCPR